MIIILLMIPYVSALYGLISNTVIDSWEYDTEEAWTHNRYALLKLADSEYYVMTCNGDTGSDGDGFLRILHVWDSNGTINRTLHDKWEYDTADGHRAGIIHISGDVYAVFYYDGSTAAGRIWTTTIWDNNGTLRRDELDSVAIDYLPVMHPSLIHVTGDIYAIVYQEDGGGFDYWIETFEITSAGSISADAIDTEEFHDGTAVARASCLSATMVDTDTIAIVYTDTTDDGFLITYNISAAGAITDTPAWSQWEYDDARGAHASITKVDGNVFAICYSDTDSDGQMKTVTIADTGQITAAWIDTFEFDHGDTIAYITGFKLDDCDVFGIVYQDVNIDGNILTVNVTAAGAIDAAKVDSLVFSSDSLYFNAIQHMNREFYLIVYSASDYDGFTCTVNITSQCAPLVNTPYPANESTGVQLQIQCSIHVYDSTPDFTITWFENSTGSWVNRGQNLSASSGTYTWSYTQASTESTKYWWKVACDDGLYNTTAIYWFITRVFPIFVSEVYPAPGATGVVTNPILSVNITHLNGYEVNVTFYVNDSTILRIVSMSNTSGSPCNHTYYSTMHHYTFSPWLLNHKYSWYIHVSDGYGNSRNFPNESTDGDAYSTWYLYNFTTRTTNNTNNLTVYNNTVDVTGYYEQHFRNATGWHLWMNYTGTGTGWSGGNLSVINPNPGDGTHLTEALVYGVGGNILRTNSTGLTTSVDVTYNNFTTPATTLPGAYSSEYDSYSYGGPTMQNDSTVYNTAWTNTSGQKISGNLYAGQLENAGDYFIERGYLIFNTSGIPDEATISNAYVRLVVYEDIGMEVDFNVTVQQTKPPSPHNPLIPGDYNKANFPPSATFGNRNITGLTDEDWFNITINATGLADINKSGYTNWILRSDQDIRGDAPGAGVDEWIGFCGPGGVTPTKAPHLVVNYTVPSSNWQHIVNLTWLSNSSGAWAVYNQTHVFSNCTVTVPAVNFSSNNTYYWNVTYESNNTNSGVTNVFHFETMNDTGGAGISVIVSGFAQRNTLYFTIGIFGGLAVGMVMWNRKNKRRNI